MRKQSLPYQDSDNTLNDLKGELLTLLLEEESAYPWNITDPEAEAYLTELEASFSLVDCLDDDELSFNADSLFSCLNECWDDLEQSQVSPSLFAKFGDYMPAHLLEKIVQQAQEAISFDLSPLQQLIECVKPLLSNWAEEDLQIFARPLVYAMRGSNGTKQVPWSELSDVEQVRLTMKVAQEALKELKQESSLEEE
jgi:hypothetical protein